MLTADGVERGLQQGDLVRDTRLRDFMRGLAGDEDPTVFFAS